MTDAEAVADDTADGTAAAAVIVMTTVDDASAADRMASALVEQQLAACVQVLPITSHYRWEGKLERNAELLLLVKTTGTRAAEVEQWLGANHPYDVPEVLVVPASGGSPSYLQWLTTETAGDRDGG